MKNLILIITVSLFSVNSFAQLTYNWVPQDTIIIDNLDPTAYSEYLIEQQNITNDTLVLGVEVVYNTIPITWDGMICIYGTCFGEIPVAGTFNQMDPIFDTLKGYTKLTVNPMGDLQGGGIVRVRVFDANNPNDIGDTCTWIVNSFSTGINDISVNNLSVYPNPSTDFITVGADSKFNVLKTYDFSGREVMNTYFTSTTEKLIDISQLKSGVYFVNTYFDSEMIGTQKITKNE